MPAIDSSTSKQNMSNSPRFHIQPVWLYVTMLLGISLVVVGYFAYRGQIEANQLQNNLFELTEANQFLQAQVTQLQTDKHEAEANLGQLQLARDNLQGDLAEQENQVQAQQTAIANLTQQAQDAQATLTVVEAENEQRLNQIDMLETENRRVQLQLAVVESEYENLVTSQRGIQDILAQEQARLLLISQADRIATIPGTALAPEASATFYTDAAQLSGLLLVKDLPASGVRETYQLWLIPAASDPISAGEVNILADQPAWTMITIPVEAQGFEFIGVSREAVDWQPEQGPTVDMIVLLGSGTN